MLPSPGAACNRIAPSAMVRVQGKGKRLFDTIIRRGRIVDGTGAPWFPGDVGLIGRRIGAVGRLDGAVARTEIDASGLVVAPGFVDIHEHSDFTLLADPRAASAVHQGVTTVVPGNCG